jgi:hypothetical protein
MPNRAVLIGLALCCSNAASAQQNDCAIFFSQDIHNKLVITDLNSGQRVSSSSYCSSSAEAKQQRFSVSYAGIGLGYDQANAVSNALCDEKFTDSDFTSQQSRLQTIVDPAIVQAAAECIKLYARGLHYSVHSDSDTNSVVISINYSGPDAISIKDILLNGNIECDGRLFNAWNADKEKTVPLDTKDVALNCRTKDTAASGSSDDIRSGSVTIITDAGPVYAQIPRRFSPSLEDQFSALQAAVGSLQERVEMQAAILSSRILASASIVDGQLISITDGATMDLNTGRLAFSNPSGLRFVPITSAYRQMGQAYTTRSCYTREIGQNYIVLKESALDTSGRVFPAGNCSVTIVGY